jgi:hypothetical protein
MAQHLTKIMSGSPKCMRQVSGTGWTNKALLECQSNKDRVNKKLIKQPIIAAASKQSVCVWGGAGAGKPGRALYYLPNFSHSLA